MKRDRCSCRPLNGGAPNGPTKLLFSALEAKGLCKFCAPSGAALDFATGRERRIIL